MRIIFVAAVALILLIGCAGLKPEQILKSKSHIGNLFAAAAAVQVGLGAELASRRNKDQQVMANCFGHGSEQGSFILETI